MSMNPTSLLLSVDSVSPLTGEMHYSPVPSGQHNNQPAEIQGGGQPNYRPPVAATGGFAPSVSSGLYHHLKFKL
jgi:hypothetical protein